MRNNTNFKLILLISLFSLSAFSKKPLPKRGVGKDFFKYISKIKNPFELRDPFKSPLKRQTTKKRKTSKTGYTDGNSLMSGSRVNWATILLTQVTVTGVIIGENRRALITVPGNTVCREVSNYEYENDENEKKREIFMLRPAYFTRFVEEFKSANKYAESSDFITEKLKKVAV